MLGHTRIATTSLYTYGRAVSLRATLVAAGAIFRRRASPKFGLYGGQVA